MSSLPDDVEARIDRFDLRGIHPAARFGTASDRYAGWIGQIYPEGAYKVSSRKRKLGGQTFDERQVPIASVADYFEHFDVLELDFTFYRPLREPDGEPGQNLFVLQNYAEHAPAHARFLLKAPQAFFARHLRRSGPGGKPTYEDNPDYLDADACIARFLVPAQELLGERLAGIIFEQEYQRVKDSPSPQAHIGALDAFFDALPRDVPLHIEMRSPHLLVEPYFDWLETVGVGHVFSHWTWLPPIREQWRLAGGRFTETHGHAVARLLTPPKTPYAKAYAKAHPFDRALPEYVDAPWAKAMILDATALVMQAAQQEARVEIILNNRAYGNAPELGREIARSVRAHAGGTG